MCKGDILIKNINHTEVVTVRIPSSQPLQKPPPPSHTKTQETEVTGI